MKKLLSLLLVLVLSLGLLAACGSDSDDSSSAPAGDNQGPTADDGIISTDPVKFIDANGEAVYRIIRSASATSQANTDVTNAATFLFTQMRNKLGVTSRQTTDDIEDGTDTYEILVGDTNRPESAKVKEYFLAKTTGFKDQYIICTIGKKIVIYSPGKETLRAACEYFLNNFVSKDGVTGGIKYIKDETTAKTAITVNGVSIANFKIVRRHYNESYITQAQINELITKLDETYFYKTEYVEDQYVAEGDYEIVIGKTNRKDSPNVFNYDEYKIKIAGKKVFIDGGSVESTAIAVAEFGKMLQKGALTDADSVDGTYSAAIAGYDKSKYYTRTWGDDFDGNTVDTTKWVHVGENAYSSGGFNGRTAIRSKDPNYVFVADGKFHINASYNDTQYIGGMLMTDRTMLYKYGYLEMSAVLPDAPGLWTSLWLDSRWHAQTGSNPEVGIYYDFEIDINECFGNANAVAANCHKWPTTLGEREGYPHTSLDVEPYGSRKRRVSIDEGHNFGDGFHTFGLLWDETQMTFTCDGEPYFTYEINKTAEDLDGFHWYSYIRLSAAIGFSGNPLGTIIADDDERWQTRNKFIIDYVHLYQLDDGKQSMLTGDAIWQK
ncbi:MAG: glycoside hydrolase family 16 protein [Clostridia bacterium]|nr:glycoside hydrolase family 16 protein [Clostridia bacterium]